MRTDKTTKSLFSAACLSAALLLSTPSTLHAQGIPTFPAGPQLGAYINKIETGVDKFNSLKDKYNEAQAQLKALGEKGMSFASNIKGKATGFELDSIRPKFNKDLAVMNNKLDDPIELKKVATTALMEPTGEGDVTEIADSIKDSAELADTFSYDQLNEIDNKRQAALAEAAKIGYGLAISTKTREAEFGTFVKDTVEPEISKSTDDRGDIGSNTYIMTEAIKRLGDTTVLMSSQLEIQGATAFREVGY